MLNLQAEVVGKVENNSSEPFHVGLKLTVNGEDLKFQGAAYLPTVAVDEDTYNAVKVGDTISTQ